jgi:hypothetical protein
MSFSKRLGRFDMCLGMSIRNLLIWPTFILSGGLFGVLFGLSTGCSTLKNVYQPEADRQGIREIVRIHLPELQPCYERAIEERPGAEGKIIFEWNLGPDGKISNLVVKEADPKIVGVIDCVSAMLRSWPFPKPENDEFVSVTYPFYFSENGKIHSN